MDQAPPCLPHRETGSREGPAWGRKLGGGGCVSGFRIPNPSLRRQGRATGLRQEDTQGTLGSLGSRGGSARKMVPVLTSRQRQPWEKAGRQEAGHAPPSPSLCGREGAGKGRPSQPGAGPDGTLVAWAQLPLPLSLPQPRRAPQPCHLPQPRSRPETALPGPLRGASKASRGRLSPPPELTLPESYSSSK